MTTNLIRREPRNWGFPIWFGVTGTVVSLLVGGFVLADNLKGFRDAGNFATLLSAIFSIISTFWLITTVLRQGEELKLQREELRLQREETKRIADEAKDQNGFLKLQIKISHQNFLIEQIRSIFSSDEFAFKEDVRSIQLHGREKFIAVYGRIINTDAFFIDPFENHIVVKIYDLTLKQLSIDPKKSKFCIPYNKIKINIQNSRYRLLKNIYLNSLEFDCGNFFLNELAYAAGRTETITAKQICIILNLAAKKS